MQARLAPIVFANESCYDAPALRGYHKSSLAVSIVVRLLDDLRALRRATRRLNCQRSARVLLVHQSCEPAAKMERLRSHLSLCTLSATKSLEEDEEMDNRAPQLAHTTKCRNNVTRREYSSRLGPLRTAVLSTLFVSLCASITVIAQSDNAQVSGFVKDTTGAVISGARVVMKSQTKNVERTAVTNDQGYYVISNLPPDIYSVTIEHPGFKRFTVSDKKVDPNIATTVDVNLEVGQVTEAVTVVAQSAAVQTETATVGKLVEEKQIQSAMLNGRNPLFLALLKPGVSGGTLGGFSFGLTTGGLNINGSRTQDNLITFDG